MVFLRRKKIKDDILSAKSTLFEIKTDNLLPPDKDHFLEFHSTVKNNAARISFRFSICTQVDRLEC